LTNIDPNSTFRPSILGADSFGLCAPKGYYKPFKYDWCFEAHIRQAHQMHWVPSEVTSANDISDWRNKLSDRERNLLTQLFRFFTTGDVDVGQAYLDKYIPIFRNEEVRTMLTSFANMESIHAHAYSLLIDQIGIPEAEYQAFRGIKEMAAKHDYTSSFSIENESDVARALAVFSGFTEGLQLFSTFAILMSFARGDRPGGAVMTGMNQIVQLSVRDESFHVQCMTRLFRTFIEERPYLWTTRLKGDIYGIAEAMLKLEEDFIDLAYEQGDTPGLERADVKIYIRTIANRRLSQLGLKEIFAEKEHPLFWLDQMMAGLEHVNFFENRGTEYSRATLAGSWGGDVWAQRPIVVASV
jgi:ribonucleoside-diphosphate reductase beta chain